MISDGMRGAMVGAKEERTHRQSRLVQYLVETIHMHNTYAFGYFICEALNFINVVRELNAKLILFMFGTMEMPGNLLLLLLHCGIGK